MSRRPKLACRGFSPPTPPPLFFLILFVALYISKYVAVEVISILRDNTKDNQISYAGEIDMFLNCIFHTFFCLSLTEPKHVLWN